MDQAARMIARRGRAYRTNRGKSVQLQLYSTSEGDMRTLVAAFGGNYYRHQGGFQWYLSDRDLVAKVAENARPYCYGNAQKRLEAMFALERDMAVNRQQLINALVT